MYGEGCISLRTSSNKATGSGIVNTLINKLPFELHLPGYQFCGPGTKLQKRLSRGDSGINALDVACKTHDIAYAKSKKVSDRHKADYNLEQEAWKQVTSKESKFGEKTAAWLVTNAMKIKRKMGMGCKATLSKRKKIVKRKKKKQITVGAGFFTHIQKTLKKHRKSKEKQSNLKKATEAAIAVAKKTLKAAGGKKRIKIPRIIPIPKQGGILPLIPIFAGLSALGSLAGGAAGIIRAIKVVKQSKENQFLGANQEKNILKTVGKGLFLKPYRKGMGLFLSTNRTSKN